MKKKAKQIVTRKNSPCIKVHCLPEEKEQIETMARNCALSTSSFLRNLGTGYAPKTILDSTAALELCKINADQGRLGGLLKMWLTNDERMGKMDAEQIKNLLQEIKRNQDLMFEKVKQI